MTLTKATTNSSLECSLQSSSSLRKSKDVIQVKGPSGETLEISFQRTIRVPDGKGDSELPPSMGSFPLYSVAQYKNKLPKTMALKGGLFLPMYREYLPHSKSSVWADVGQNVKRRGSTSNLAIASPSRSMLGE